MFERRHKPLLPWSAFLRRLANYAAVAFGLVALSLAIGICGYCGFERMSLTDAFLNAAMLMGGMGPTSELHTRAGKLFAAFYALYCGIVFLIAIGILIAPVVHRFLHHFHLEAQLEGSAEAAAGKNTRPHSTKK